MKTVIKTCIYNLKNTQKTEQDLMQVVNYKNLTQTCIYNPKNAQKTIQDLI